MNTEVDKQVKYVTLPYQVHFTNQIRNKLNTLLHKYFPQITYIYIFFFTTCHMVGSFFKYRDRIPDLLCSNVVINFVVLTAVRYIGHTCRNLKTRIFDHNSLFSYRTGRPLINPSFSVIRDHCRYNNRVIKEKDLKILFLGLTLVLM